MELPAEEAVPKDVIEHKFTDVGLRSHFQVASQQAVYPPETRALVTVKTAVSKEILDKMPNLEVIAVAFTGYDHVDVDECKRRGITVMNVPGYSTDGVAELAFGLVFSLLREIPQSSNHLRSGQWKWAPGNELRGKNFAVLGTGAIGMRVSELATAFKVNKLLGYDKFPNQRFIAMGGEYTKSIASLFLEADIIVVNVALTNETKGLVNRKLLQLLRPDSILVNVARGPIIDQKAMAEMLQAKRFRAALDVYDVEPMPQDDPLRKVPPEQVVLTPHLAYKCHESLQRRFMITLANLLSHFAGDAQNVVS